jgi:hypothetical protein
MTNWKDVRMAEIYREERMKAARHHDLVQEARRHHQQPSLWSKLMQNLSLLNQHQPRAEAKPGKRLITQE